MKSAHSSHSADVVSVVQSPEGTSVLPAPQGIGMAVAFDWGLAVQILVTPVVNQLLGQNQRPYVNLHIGQPWNMMLLTLLALPFAAVPAIFGEGIRRGWHWTRNIQIVANALLFLGGFASLYNLSQTGKQGNYWSLVTSVILLVFSPLIAWRLSRPASGVWFKNVTSAEARRRHGGSWPWLIAIWAIIGGILQAIAATK